jgi:hypothetical protein
MIPWLLIVVGVLLIAVALYFRFSRKVNDPLGIRDENSN